MCWFVHFSVVLQKDTPHARSQLQPLNDKSRLLAGAFPEFTMPDGICGCHLVQGQGEALAPETLTPISHFLNQSPVKRVDLWWHFTSADERIRPATEEKITLDQLTTRNRTQQLAPDTCYRISLPNKYKNPQPR